MNKRGKKTLVKKPGRGWSPARLAPLLPPLSAAGTEPPWRWLPWCLLLAFLLRAATALSGDFVIHPDEIMQYLEPAHGLVFGNTVSYWEYYYGARSWLVPSAVAAVLWLCKTTGFDSPTVYIAAVKLFFCALSLLIPLAAYLVGRRMFGEQSGRVALILTVFWYELVGFAHKPMTEFVATSLLFGLMIIALRPQRPSLPQAATAALFGVLVVAIRFQYAFIVGLVLLVPFIRAAHTPTRIAMALAAAVAILAAGVLDYFTWGGLWHSYWLNLQANLVLNEYRQEESSPWHFIGWLIVASGGLTLAATAALMHPHRRMFLFILALSVLLPHMMQAHREYRFIFVLIPIWLLLFADVLTVGLEEARRSLLTARRRQIAGYIAALLVSGLGIANAIPFQYWVYEAKSQETGYVHFIRDQDTAFALYRDLAGDDSVRGVFDATRPYFNTGGYYYLHKRVPFYTLQAGNLWNAQTAQSHVSHIIAGAPVTPGGVARTSGGQLVMRTEGDGLIPLPAYISDNSLGKLVFWSSDGQASVVEGFTQARATDKYALWTTAQSSPVRQWTSYHIAPDNEAMHPVVERAIGNAAKSPTANFGIQFAE